MKCVRCEGLMMDDPESITGKKCANCGRDGRPEEMGIENDKLENATQFAKRHGIHYTTVRYMIKRGTLTATKTGLMDPEKADKEYENRPRYERKAGKQKADPVNPIAVIGRDKRITAGAIKNRIEKLDKERKAWEAILEILSDG